MSDIVKVIAILLLIVVLIAFGPIFSILSLNTLFKLDIPVNFGTWLAALWLGMFVAAAKSSPKK